MDDRSPRQVAVVVSFASRDTMAYVRIIGNLDEAAGPDLTDALERLAEFAGVSVYVDLADTASAGTTLLTFLARVATTIAPHATWVYRPSAAARHMIELAGVDALTRWCDELPRIWSGRHFTTVRPVSLSGLSQQRWVRWR